MTVSIPSCDRARPRQKPPHDRDHAAGSGPTQGPPARRRGAIRGSPGERKPSRWNCPGETEKAARGRLSNGFLVTDRKRMNQNNPGTDLNSWGNSVQAPAMTKGPSEGRTIVPSRLAGSGRHCHSMRTAHPTSSRVQLVGEIMSPSVTAVPGEPIRTVAARMRDAGAGAAAILENGSLVGILTERDLLRSIADGLDPLVTPAARTMTARPTTIKPGAIAALAASRMVELAVRHLPVVDKGQLVGMLSARDIVTSGARYAESLAYEPW